MLAVVSVTYSPTAVGLQRLECYGMMARNVRPTLATNVSAECFLFTHQPDGVQGLEVVDVGPVLQAHFPRAKVVHLQHTTGHETAVYNQMPPQRCAGLSAEFDI